MQKYKIQNCDLVDVDKLIPNPKNPNKHPDKQIDMLAKILDFQGQRLPIVVSNRSGFIVAGHGRLEAIKKLGWDKAAVSYQDFDNEAQEYAHMIADNKIAELAKHDDSMMIDEIKELGIDDFELLGLDDFAFDAKEVELPDLAEGEKDGIAMTFQLTESQEMEVKNALDKAKEHKELFDHEANLNGSALAYICEWYVSNG